MIAYDPSKFEALVMFGFITTIGLLQNILGSKNNES
jgi:hypothetical protein